MHIQPWPDKSSAGIRAVGDRLGPFRGRVAIRGHRGPSRSHRDPSWAIGGRQRPMVPSGSFVWPGLYLYHISRIFDFLYLIVLFVTGRQINMKQNKIT